MKTPDNSLSRDELYKDISDVFWSAYSSFNPAKDGDERVHCGKAVYNAALNSRVDVKHPIGVACMKHDLVHCMACKHCLREAEAERDKLRETKRVLVEALQSIAKGAPTNEPEWHGNTGNADDNRDYGCDLIHYNLAKTARKALALASGEV